MALFDSAIGLLQDILTFFYNMTASLGIPNYGLAIILLTLAIKLILYPLTVKQVKGMKAMQDLQPKMKAMQEKYKGNPEKLNKEMALLYKESGVNPLSGCLPLLVQMPILMGIFYAIRDYHYAQLPSFFWIADLSQHDPLYILPVLSAATTYIQQKQTSSDANQQAKMMMNFMPLFIGYISINFPGGLVLYWVMSNLFQIIQQWWMYRGEAQK
ncbi:YidC/Oxa1 family membrane protein insertase [Pelosinus sp. IPA-1]|uniref:YidC/Oxa1 family membrane protein insertase n=1 Tax=Pelosinus sp. IPA-1 TaxID=3029569 RepID=UPI00243627A4|nr:YidC/Oxa1 family membrane protein insertase [Pelosinus sp. IPA-1]GMB00159.1 membrane protein [Pelosinus sp. IPA-1]